MTALSLSTDYYACTASPQPYLREIAEAGFSHIHWCHQWSTDFLYSDSEIGAIGGWLKEYGLCLLDMHGSTGQEKNWTSETEYERLAGVELVKNRVDMCARLGGHAVVLHMPRDPESRPLRRSLDELARYCLDRGVRLALENGSMPVIAKVLADYDPAYLGFCYDCGHERLGGVNLEHRVPLKDRLIVTHINDNEKSDDHMIPFRGKVDWAGVAAFLAQSSYDRCLTLEVVIHGSGMTDRPEFLRLAHESGLRLTEMVAAERRKASGGGG
jgi:sugar phosphate isomerase/epimerase